MLRALLIAAGATVAGLVAWVVVVLVLGRLDMAADLEMSGSWSVLSTVLYALPFAVGAWAGTRSGLRALPLDRAALAGAGGALAVLVAVTLSSGGTDLLSVVLPLAGAALGVELARRTSGRGNGLGAAEDSPDGVRREA